MSISPKSRKMLWGRAASRCSICRIELVMDASETDDETLIGEEAHIVAHEDDGPRGDKAFPADRRDLYGNLLLLCANHHTVVDDRVGEYPIARLAEIKSSHEQWVRSSLTGFDPAKVRDDELWAGILEEFERRVNLENWQAWTSYLLAPQPSMQLSFKKELELTVEWLLGRVWPTSHPDLREAFFNFRKVLSDFLRIEAEAFEESKESDTTELEKKYKRNGYVAEEVHQAGVAEFQAFVELCHQLVFEMTRAANLICDQVRRTVLSSYRLREGVLLVTSGPNMGFSYTTHRSEYAAGTVAATAYRGLGGLIRDLSDEDQEALKGLRI